MASVRVLVALLVALAGCGDAPVIRSSEKQLAAFAFAAANNLELAGDVVATITGTTVAAMVPFGTDVSELIATFTITGASVSVDGALQLSSASRNDFRHPVIYRVAAEDGTTADYGVVVVVARSPAKELTSLSFRAANNPGLTADVTATIDGTAVTVVVPSGTAVTALVASFTTTGESVVVAGVPQTSDATANNCASAVVYRVTAADGTTRDYTVTVVVG